MKENQILLRSVDKSRITSATTDSDRIFISRLINHHNKVRKYLSIVKVDTVLKRWKQIQKKRYTYPGNHTPGRPPFSKEIRNLVIDLKKNNYLWGYQRISNEMSKLNIPVSRDSVCRIIRKGRKEGDILPSGEWKKFLKSHWDSLFCCDFLTVETVFQQRLYVFFLMRLKDRKIVQYGITTNPDMKFLRNQLLGFMFNREDKETYLIHDNSGELKWMDYESVGIKGVSITPYSPKAGRKLAFCSPMRPGMNAYAERFVKSIRRECLDHFIVMNRRQLRNLVKSYMNYYNHMRPHQGLDGKIPDCNITHACGEIKKVPVLFGLHHHYYRKAS